jgi:hypothetical protein
MSLLVVKLIPFVAAAALAGCGSSLLDGSHKGRGDDASASTAVSGSDARSDAAASPAPVADTPTSAVTEEPPACSDLGGLANEPKTIKQFVAFVNALPKPVSVSCVLAALKRPLAVSATNSAFSAQPSSGADNPRIFIGSGDLVISVVTGGTMAAHIELGETTTPESSIKGDLAFPLVADFTEASPYEALYDAKTGLTSCSSFCHEKGQVVATIGATKAFSSLRIRPSPAHDVSLTDLARLRADCAGSTTERCRMFQALFFGAAPVPYRFPAALPTP